MVAWGDMLQIGNRIDERKGNMARRRYQSPTPKLRGKAWTLEYREDEEQPDGAIRRVKRKVTLGYKHELPTEKLARRAAAPILARINAMSARPSRPIRFAEFAERWRAKILPLMSPSTQQSIRSKVWFHLVPRFGDHYLYEINPEMVQSFVSDLLEKVCEQTVWNIVMAMRSIWNTALAWGYTQDNVFENVRLRVPSLPEDVRCFSLDEVQRIIAAAEEPHRTFYWLASETGMRSGELCALRWIDVNTEAGIATVRRSVWRGKFKDTKSRRVRRFSISRKLSTRLDEMKSIRKPFTDLIFHTRSGTPWDGNIVVKRKLQPMLEKLGIPRGAMHAFRHFNGSQMDSDGAPVAVARDRLGHSSIVVTNRYQHSVSSDDRAVADRLAASIAANAAI